MSRADFGAGALVVDREDDDPNPDHAVVLNTPPLRACDWTIYRLDTTVADENPDYPEDDPVVVVAFREHLDERLPEWRDREDYWTMQEINENRLQFYAFPASRLMPAEEASVAGNETDEDADVDADAADGDSDDDHDRTQVDLDALADRLKDAGCAVQHRGDRLQVSKLGEIYRVTETGDVIGDGALRERLENAVGEDAPDG